MRAQGNTDTAFKRSPWRCRCDRTTPRRAHQANREVEALREAYKERAARFAAKAREWEEERTDTRRRLDAEAAELEQRRQAMSLELHVRGGARQWARVIWVLWSHEGKGETTSAQHTRCIYGGGDHVLNWSRSRADLGGSSCSLGC